MTMDFDDFSDKKTKTDKIMEKRDKIKDKMIEKLRALGFSDLQLSEVIEIIDTAEARIEAIKVSLNGTNINTDDPTPVMKLAMDEIKSTQLKMGIDVREKINEIIQYNSNKKS